MKKYHAGEIVTGCVTGIEKYGVFVSLDEYYNGLIHISEISDDYVRNIHDYVKIGETINAKIMEENSKTHHVKLSIKNMDYRILKNLNGKFKFFLFLLDFLGKNSYIIRYRHCILAEIGGYKIVTNLNINI